jgi:hypothetical protein
MQGSDAQQHDSIGRRTLWLSLAALLILVALVRWMYTPPAPLPANAPAAQFSAQRAAGVLTELIGSDVPHPLASAADARIREQLVARLRALGIPSELQSGWSCDTSFACGWVVNVIARLDGTDPGSGTVLLAAHYDSVPAGPGAGDDGVGVASVLEIARILRHEPARRHPIILLINEGEEAGLLGARLFVAEHPAAREVRAVVNLDARGDSGPSLMFETGAATEWSLRLFGAAVSRPMSNSLYYFVYKLLPNDTDFTVFKASGYEGLNFALIGDVERYHTPQDKLANLDLRSLQHQGQNALASVQALAAAELGHAPAHGAVFFDVLGRTLALWPASWSAAIGIVLTLLLLGTFRIIGRRAGVSAPALMHALVAWVISWLAAGGLAACLLSLVRSMGAVPPAEAYSWAAYPQGMHAACLALALLAPACTMLLTRRRADSWTLWLAHALVLTGLMLLCCLAAPELSFVFVLPALATLLVAWPAARRAAGPAAAAGVPTSAIVLPLLVFAFALAPMLLLLYPALGTDAWPVITAVSALCLLGLAPMLRLAGASDVRSYVWLGLVVTAVGCGIALLCPTYSARMPQRTLLWYVLDADAGRARWVLQPDSKSTPPQLVLHDDQAALEPALPTGIVAGVHRAAAPKLDYAAPELQLLDAMATERGTVYRLRLRSPRGAPELELALPDGHATSATLLAEGGRRLPVKFWRAANHTLWLQLIGAPAEGVVLEVEVPGAQEVATVLLDRSYGLPAAGAELRRPGAQLTTASQDGDLTIVQRAYTLSRTQLAPNP